MKGFYGVICIDEVAAPYYQKLISTEGKLRPFHAKEIAAALGIDPHALVVKCIRKLRDHKVIQNTGNNLAGQRRMRGVGQTEWEFTPEFIGWMKRQDQKQGVTA